MTDVGIKKKISLCLALWCRSSKNYQQLRDSKVLILPHGNTLQLYKNCVDQQAGFQSEVFLWMQEEAKKHYPSDGSFLGGICIDEMSIQEDLCMVKTNGEVRLVGFVDMGEESDHLNTLCSGKKDQVLATHVLRFKWLQISICLLSCHTNQGWKLTFSVLGSHKIFECLRL